MERSLAEIDEAELEGVDAERALLQLRECQADYARTDAAALGALDQEIVALGYDAAAHELVRKELTGLLSYEARFAALQTAQTAADLLRAKLRENESLELVRREAVAELAVDFDRVAREIAQSSSVVADLVAAQDAVDALVKTAAGLRTRLGGAEQLLRHCDYLAEQRKEKAAQMLGAIEEKGIFDELAVAFGKRGIQAMIIDSALPEIEDEANSLLARLTDNRMHVKLETQREAKSSDGVIETLDIKIADELGYRNYELYSGGEAFRVNFALRIALSKLLARRAGARLQTLILDEGFGTQDVSGRERLVEAINSIAPDFDCILVITHIQELKDAFPVRIDVFKGADGSQLAMNA
jgi:exonuclease SbcC